MALEIPKELALAYNDAKARAAAATREADRLYAAIAQLAGDETSLTVGGVEVLNYEYKNTLRTKALVEEHPDLVDQYSTYVTEKKFNVIMFRQQQPDMFREYQTRAMRIITQ
jgi:hypothetical protein